MVVIGLLKRSTCIEVFSMVECSMELILLLTGTSATKQGRMQDAVG